MLESFYAPAIAVPWLVQPMKNGMDYYPGAAERYILVHNNTGYSLI